VQFTARQYATVLNKSLDDIGVPSEARERSAILSKMLHIPKQQAWSLLEGHVMPDAGLMEKISCELDVDLEKRRA
jgi:hypothetical protein